MNKLISPNSPQNVEIHEALSQMVNITKKTTGSFRRSLESLNGYSLFRVFAKVWQLYMSSFHFRKQLDPVLEYHKICK